MAPIIYSTGVVCALGAPLAPEHCRCASRVDCESTESPSESPSVPHDARASPCGTRNWLQVGGKSTPDKCCL